MAEEPASLQARRDCHRIAFDPQYMRCKTHENRHRTLSKAEKRSYRPHETPHTRSEMMSGNELFLQEMGQRIIKCRKKLGLTQEALAEKGNMTTQFVSYAELGKRAMRPENLMKVSSALEVSADFLLTGDIIDKDCLLLSEKLQKLTPSQFKIIENIIDECVALYGDK